MEFEGRTMPSLWRWYENESRKLSFKNTTLGVKDWQQQLREKILGLLGEFPAEKCALDVRMIESISEGTIRRDKIVLQTQLGEYMPCYVLTPLENNAPHPTIIALHGHGTWGARSLIGAAESGREREFINNFHIDYAYQLALKGFKVFVPALRGFGERMEDEPDVVREKLVGDEMWHSSCRVLSVNAMMAGKTLLGLRLWDVMRLIDYTQSCEDVKVGGLGCVGFSGGGTLGMYATAMSEKITCAYLSGSVNTFRHSLMTIEHCLCNTVPGILQYAEMGDIVGLIAPRPLLVEAGRNDPIYPLAGVEAALETLRPIYAALQADDHLQSHIFEGKHEWNGEPAPAWFRRWLG